MASTATTRTLSGMNLRARLSRHALAASIGIASIATVACTQSVEAPQDERAKAASELRHHRHGPLHAVVEAAFERGDLSEEQHAAIEVIRDRVDAERSNRHAIKERFRAPASDIVRAGSADSDQFDAATEEAVRVIEARMRLTSSALTEVHAVLEAEQRVAVASALRARIAERFDRKAKRTQKHKRFEKVVGYLMLTPVQIAGLERVRTEILGDEKVLRPSREELEAIVDAFEGDEFGAAVQSFQDRKLTLIRGRVKHLAKHTNTALSLLTDEQRDLLAELIEVGPEAAGLSEPR